MQTSKYWTNVLSIGWYINQPQGEGSLHSDWLLVRYVRRRDSDRAHRSQPGHPGACAQGEWWVTPSRLFSSPFSTGSTVEILQLFRLLGIASDRGNEDALFDGDFSVLIL